MMQCVHKYGIIWMVLRDWSSKKRGEFHRLTDTVRVSTLSKVRVGIRISVRIRVSLVLVIAWG